MEKKTLTFRADNQILVGQNVPARFASDTVSYIEAVFDLGENWSGFDAVKAVWSTDFESVCTVLDSSGACVVPWEVLERVGDVCVNLVGSISENDSLTDRLTTYPAKAITVDANATVCGSETSPITPSQFDQFAAAVRADADRAEEGATAAAASASSAAASATSASGSATDASQSANGAAQAAQSASESAESASESAQSASDSAADAEEAKNTILNMTATATTLPEGSDATVDYNNGVMAFGIPRGDTGEKGAKGDTGETGATPQMSIGTVETLAPDEDATATITGTAENPVLNLGLPKGETGDVSKAELASLMPLETVSGSVASFSDGSAVFDAEQALISLEPIQSGSGTPSPDNVRPISGHDSASVVVSGKNLCDNADALLDLGTGVTYSDADGYYLPRHYDTGVSHPLFVNDDGLTGQLTLSFKQKQNTAGQVKGYLCFVYTDGTYGTPHVYPSTANTWYEWSITSDESKTVDYVRYRYSSAGGDSWIKDIQVELGTTATDYVPYVPSETYTTSLGRTVYGGTVDLVSGVLTVDRAMVDLGSLTWTYSGGFFRATNLTNFKRPSSNSAAVNAISSAYSAMSWNAISRTSNGAFAVSAGSDNPIFCNTEYSDANSFKTAMNGAQLCYELATPQTYQLTPQAIALLTGDNNVWSEDGSIEVKYRANIGLYVDKKISEVNA